MAKSNKSEGKTPAKKSAAKKSSSSKAKANAPATTGPTIDTSLAAADAAKMLAAGFNVGAAGNTNAPRQESAMFKQLKAGLNKPTSAGMSNLLDKSHTPEIQRTHAPSFKPIGQRQTRGADVTRSGVPRRNPG